MKTSIISRYHVLLASAASLALLVVGPIEVVKDFRVAYFLENGLLIEYMEGDP